MLFATHCMLPKICNFFWCHGSQELVHLYCLHVACPCATTFNLQHHLLLLRELCNCIVLVWHGYTCCTLKPNLYCPLMCAHISIVVHLWVSYVCHVSIAAYGKLSLQQPFVVHLHFKSCAFCICYSCMTSIFVAHVMHCNQQSHWSMIQSFAPLILLFLAHHFK